ncbi:hypothetical protein [Desulfomonile tiedjei]|uniref:Uncharacterized protein n=1 Tax=Desulfomonile tiedjei (strain ATCC 49306 / DSM 6799 / DCB-1) TaxID=706587 RepID=I4C5A5_DESTA|nr:hypothetical protein [Desulfomonile tiedjei]AFM24746.1 hypothetical protein Desti_2043 [Desulfomonile tiedjei DSM 6799]
MKSKSMWCVAVLALTLFPLFAAQAYSLDGQMGYNQGPVRIQTYNSANPSQPLHQKVPQYQVPTYPAATVPNRQRVVAQQQATSGTAYQERLPDIRTNQMQRQATKPAAKKKPVQSAAAKAGHPSRQTPVKQGQLQSAAYSYQPTYPAQYRSAPQQGYYQNPSTGFYGNSYQNRYMAAPNYYQGYSYSGWGSAGQACPPGRA